MLLQIVRSFRQSVALKPAEESFRQGWEEVRAGETLPISDFFQESPLAGADLDLSREKSPIRSDPALCAISWIRMPFLSWYPDGQS